MTKYSLAGAKPGYGRFWKIFFLFLNSICLPLQDYCAEIVHCKTFGEVVIKMPYYHLILYWISQFLLTFSSGILNQPDLILNSWLTQNWAKAKSWWKFSFSCFINFFASSITDYSYFRTFYSKFSHKYMGGQA